MDEHRLPTDPADWSRAPTVTFRPDARLTWAAAAVALLAAIVAATSWLSADRVGGVLAVAAALLAGGYALSDVVFSPRLVATNAGVRVRSPGLLATLPWPLIESVRADTRSRFGLASTTLEVDAGEVLVVLSRRAIGTDPVAAADLVNALRPIAG